MYCQNKTSQGHSKTEVEGEYRLIWNTSQLYLLQNLNGRKKHQNSSKTSNTTGWGQQKKIAANCLALTDNCPIYFSFVVFTAKSYKTLTKQKDWALVTDFNTLTVGFWCQGIAQKFFGTFDTSFDTNIMVKSGAIKIFFKSYGPFQSYLLTGQADSAKKAG